MSDGLQFNYSPLLRGTYHIAHFWGRGATILCDTSLDDMAGGEWLNEKPIGKACATCVKEMNKLKREYGEK